MLIRTPKQKTPTSSSLSFALEDPEATNQGVARKRDYKVEKSTIDSNNALPKARVVLEAVVDRCSCRC